MGQPTYLMEGTTPLAGDGKRRVLEKLLGAYQNLPNADPANNPAQTDTLRKLRTKLVRATKTAQL